MATTHKAKERERNQLIADMIEQYLDGMSTLDIAKERGFSRQYVASLLNMHPQWQSIKVYKERAMKKKRTIETYEAKRLKEAGVSVKDICDKLGLKKGTVYALLRS